MTDQSITIPRSELELLESTLVVAIGEIEAHDDDGGEPGDIRVPNVGLIRVIDALGVVRHLLAE
jgi:hypothetical protein